MSPSGAGFSPIDPQIPEDASAGAAAGLLAGLAIGTESGSSSFGPVGALAGGIIGGTVGFFQDLLSGGSGGLPGWVVWKLNHQGGNLQLWAQIIGIDPALAPSWQPTAGIQLVGDNTPPLQNQQAREPVCEGNWKCIKESTTTASPLGDDARTGSALNNCTCYWACVACNGSVDLYNSYLDRLKTFGIAIQATNGEGCVAPYPGSETACPAK